MKPQLGHTISPITLWALTLLGFGLPFSIRASLQAQPFTTVINIPPDPDIGDNESIDSDTQLNLGDGGSIGRSFDAGFFDGTSTNVEVNISGGMVGNSFEANSGSMVDISGGLVGWFFVANAGSTVNLSGGMFGPGFHTESGSTAIFTGAEFRLDGELIAGLDVVGSSLPFDVPADSVLSGTLADGTPFAFSSLKAVADNIAVGTLTLRATTLPAIGPASILSGPALELQRVVVLG